jgi:A/G-specific adenine glycosylase
VIHRLLLRWYDSHRRILPWREKLSPYQTWISEIMLQQTQVSTVLPYYKRFLVSFANLASLAKAKEEEVLRLWAGLGYYSRARNLHKAARLIMSRHHGRFPNTMNEMLALPGIGRYTAGAILSIAFKQPFPVLDGNVMRVFSRLFAIKGNIKSAQTQAKLWKLAEDLVPRDRPGDWNQGLMELGALICVPESPRCGQCPLARLCAAYKAGAQDRLPQMPRSKKAVKLNWICLWIERDGKMLLHKRQNSERFLGGHWALPEPRHFHNGIQPKIDRIPIKRTSHSITHHRITLDVYRAAIPAKPLPHEMRWVPKRELNRMLVSSLWKKASLVTPAARLRSPS